MKFGVCVPRTSFKRDVFDIDLRFLEVIHKQTADNDDRWSDTRKQRAGKYKRMASTL